MFAVHILPLILLYLGHLHVCHANPRILSTYQAKTDINNVVIIGDKVYVGAVNKLLSLNTTDLSLIHEVDTGPVLDSPFCNFDSSSCIRASSLKQTDNHNKILHATSEGVLACGSVRQGVCDVRSLKNIHEVLQSGTVPIAANSANSSTVSLIGNSGYLYVAATYSGDSPYRENFPAIATREPPLYYTINSGSIEGEAAVQIRAEYRSRFRVSYVGAFFDEHYVYYASVQNKYVQAPSLANPLVSKIIRICANDQRYVSYSEIELQCRGADNTNFNVIQGLSVDQDRLIGIFIDGSGSQSAICIFDMQKVRLTFWYNIDRCRGGALTRGLPHIGRDSKCTNKSHLPLSEDTCQLGVGGSIEADAVAAVQYSDKSLAAVAARSIGKTTLVVVGSKSGEILQFHLHGEHLINLAKYADFVAGLDPISHLVFIDDDKYLAVSGKEIITLRTSTCQQYTTCESCTTSADPLCGWCLFEGSCTSISFCANGLTEKCPRSTGAATPANSSVQVTDVRVFLPAENLPEPVDTNYECYFGSQHAPADWAVSGINCPLPRSLPVIPTGVDHIVVPLEVRTAQSSKPILASNYTFYDCNQHSICSSCSASQWRCSWCSAERRCISEGGYCSGNGTSTCVHIDNSTETLVANGANASIVFPVVNLAKSGRSAGLICRIRTDSSYVTVEAKVKNDLVQCQPTQLSYVAETPTTNYDLELVRGSELIDRTHVTMFKCSEMASDCSQCLALDPKWSCTWCSAGCQNSNFCARPPKSSRPDTLCTKPTIQSFEPRWGPISGGTRIDIRGRDLGSRIEDVRGRVYVAGTKCKVVEYYISVRIVCVVEAGTGSGPIRITIGKSGRRNVDSNTFYQFVSPAVESVFPTYGPISGGTKLTIYGKNLNVGSNRSVSLDDLPCQILPESNSTKSVICVTSPSTRTRETGSLKIQIDDYVQTISSKYTYRPDPVIKSIDPTASFESGGRVVTVQGANLDSVQYAHMYLLNAVEGPAELVSDMSECQVENSTFMFCLSPRVRLPPTHSTSTYARWPVGFRMDDVQPVRNLGYRVQMTTVPDPQFLPFKGIHVHSPEHPLVITGNYLSQAAGPQEYRIYVGTERCLVTLLDSRQILCKLPATQPSASDENGDPVYGSRPLVTVKIGNIRAELGLIEYESRLRIGPWRLLILGAVGCTLLTVACILLFTLWRRRSNQHERDYKRIQMQMDQMESTVRNECKQAFAELQTDVTDLMADIGDSGIPYHEKAEFISRLLFSDAPDSSDIVRSWGMGMNIYSSQMPIALGQFDSLLWDKHFIFVLVQTIESDSTISVSERANLCSLIIGSLIRNMPYCTDVVLTLLAAHIENSVQNRSTHLLFRRSDSVVEKLLSLWLTISMYPYLSDITHGPGRPFFLLYRALKCQTEKGPIDAVTGSSRYSLSEQKLLRESVDIHAVQLLVIPLDGFDQSPVVCRVLQCDTISQVKSKILDLIYKSHAFSSRISVEQFDLEWRCPKRGTIILSDDDKPNVKGLKKLNTVGAYNLPNNALLSMQSRSPHSFTYRSGSSDTTCSAWSSAHLLDNTAVNRSEGQYYHLSNPPSGVFSLDKSKKCDDSVNGTVLRNIPEVYLTRLLTSKGTIQKFVDDFFDAALFLHQPEVPAVLKYLFDFLDHQAERNQVTDPDVVHSWKTNAFILRFWVNLIKNPNMLFDIQRQDFLDSSLSVIGQTLIDACSRSQFPLGKESPSSKLLFAKDICRYRPIAFDMFRRVKRQATIGEKQLYEHTNSMSKSVNEGVSSTAAVGELLQWVKANGVRFSDMLCRDPIAIQHRLPDRLQQIVQCSITEPEHIYATLQ
uniref:Sema domain-containing protein n=1 Tax=Steinernema glaseri TaxID=37863 RepID=A0A1I7Y844_9BILA